MTSLETGRPMAVTEVDDDRSVRNDAITSAVRRDLARLDRVLGEPVTAVRREAIGRHLTFMLDHLVAHFALHDELIWPAAALADPALDDARVRVAQGHDDLAGVFNAVRDAVIGWRTDSADSRRRVHSVVGELAAALHPVLELDVELLPLACAVTGPVTDPRGSRLIDLRTAPTRAAKRLFWLLDDLGPQQTDRLLRDVPLAMLWVLRNGFSGAYNRGSYLMWVGGGTGPAA